MYLHTHFTEKGIFHNVEIVSHEINRNFENNKPLIILIISIDQWSSQDSSVIVQALHKWRASDGTCQESSWRGRAEKRQPRGWAHRQTKCHYHLGPFRAGWVQTDELNGKKASKMGHWKEWKEDQAREKKWSTVMEQITESAQEGKNDWAE